MPYKDYELKKQKEKERYARKMADPEKAERYKEQTKKWKEENRDYVNVKVKERKAKNKAYFHLTIATNRLHLAKQPRR